MNRYLMGSVLGVILAFGACRSMPQLDATKVGAGVQSTLRAHGAAHVLVALTEPAGDRSSERTVTIARIQREVLADVEPAGFRHRQLFAAVPAIAGTVLSEKALQALAVHRLVRRVDLDAGGGGTVIR
jgi:hypothetical protein